MNCVPHSFTIFRKCSLLEVGGYDPNLIIAHDYDLWIRLLEKGRGHNLNEVLGVFRDHEESISTKKERILICEVFQVQWRAYQKLGESFLKMVLSLSKRLLAWFLPARMRSYLRATSRK